MKNSDLVENFWSIRHFNLSLQRLLVYKSNQPSQTKAGKLNPSKNMYKALLAVFLTGALACLLSSCQDYSPVDLETILEAKRKRTWEESIGGTNDPNQTWITGRMVTLDVLTSEPAVIRVYSIEQPDRYLYAKQMVDGEKVINITIPHNSDTSFGVEYRTKSRVDYRRIEILNQQEQQAVVDFSMPSTRAEGEHEAGVDCYAHPDYLCNANAKHISGYNTYAPWAWEVMAEALEERKLPLPDRSATNFRLVSKGKFYISMLYGYTGTPDDCYIGYYYYKGGIKDQTYDSVQFVELCEVLNADYYTHEGRDYAKVRYKLSSDGLWHDASFDHYAQPDRSKDLQRTIWRKSSGNYNTNYLYNLYYKGTKQEAELIKGLSFCVDAPPNSHVGFYLVRTNKSNGNTNPLLRQKYIKQNVNPDVIALGKNFAMAFVDSDQNYLHNGYAYQGSSYNLQYYAAVSRYNGYTFVGLDDNPTSGSDHDSNDVTFALTAGIDGIEPEVELPDIVVYDKDEEQYYNEDGTKTDEPKPSNPLVEWTIAFEDMGTTIDFDFNDVVIGVTPDPATATARLVLKAASGTVESELHYDGPNGDVNYGSVHTLFGGDLVNGGAQVTDAYKTIQYVPWPETYTIAQDAKRFYILVKQPGEEPRRVDLSTSCSAGTTSAPEALCIASNGQKSWNWPREGISITTAYPGIGEWAKDATTTDNEWYKSPVKDKVVSPMQ